MTTRKELEAAITQEIENWPGVEVRFVEGDKQPRARMRFAGNILSAKYPPVPGSMAAVHSAISDVRRTLKRLGAERAQPAPKNVEDEAYNKPKPARENPIIVDKEQPKPAAKAEPAKEPRAKAAEVAVEEKPAAEEKGPTIEERAAELVDGIYFNLEAEVYHAVAALGSGSLCELNISAGTFWAGSWLDPRRKEPEDEEQTKAQILGRAYHCARLEPDLFEDLFVRELDKADFPSEGFVGNGTEIGDALAKIGETKKKAGESVEEQAQRLEDAGYEGTIWPLEKAKWEKSRGGRQPIPAKYWDDILEDMKRLHSIPEVAELLTDGFAEVSVIWTDEHGMRCKARFDYLRASSWADFKTFANSQGKEVDRCIFDAIQFNRYYIQAGHYRDAAEAIRAGKLDIMGEATAEHIELLDKIRERERPLECWYVFQEKDGIPNLLAKRFEFMAVDVWRDHEISIMLEDEERQALVRDAMGQPTAIWQKAKQEIAHAKGIFNLYSSVYSPGEPWHPIEPIGRINDASFNPFWLEGKR